jgi:PEP-CTERM motif
MKLVSQMLIVVASLVTTSAHALLTQSYGTDPGGAIDYTFDDLLGNSSLSISGGTIQTASIPFVALKPLDLVDNGKFWSLDPSNLPATSPGIITFSTAVKQLSFLWGSPDYFNDLVVHLNSGNQTIFPFAANGDNNNSRYLSLTASGGDEITGLTFSSVNGNGYAFEVDNMRITQVPEPQTYTLLLAGLAAMGFVARRRGAKYRSA